MSAASPADESATPPNTIWLTSGLIGLVWAYFSVIGDLARTWVSTPDYSHGMLVLPMAAALLWSRWETMPAAHRAGAWQVDALGLLPLTLGLTLRFLGAYYSVTPVEQFSLLVTLAGVVWLTCGYRVLAWAVPIIGYLTFMIPLPYSMAVAFSAPLQRFGAWISAYLLQTVGIPALAVGNTIELQNTVLDVAYACSGLQMTVAFLAVTAAMALLSKYSWVGKLLIVALAVPIAVVCNIVRITVTGIAYQTAAGPAFQHFFHDFAGLVFIPMAIASVLLAIRLGEWTFPRRLPRTDSSGERSHRAAPGHGKPSESAPSPRGSDADSPKPVSPTTARRRGEGEAAGNATRSNPADGQGDVGGPAPLASVEPAALPSNAATAIETAPSGPAASANSAEESRQSSENHANEGAATNGDEPATSADRHAPQSIPEKAE